MQPRPCHCTPMCSLRTTNPMPVRPTRVPAPTFAGASVYRDAAARSLSHRLTRYVVLANDPAVPAVAADYWLHSERYYTAVTDAVRRIVAADPGTDAALQRLRNRPADTAAERDLEENLGMLLAWRPYLAELVREPLETADDNIYIDYLRGAGHSATTAPVGFEELRDRARELPPPAPTGREPLLVVIPLMDRGGTDRLRNLLACLIALNDQSVPRSGYRVTVAEFDSAPRWRHVVQPLVDDYVHVPGTGRFNKSWAVNAGVRHSPGRPEILCLLDADIIADHRFIERNLARFAAGGHDAHLPHTEMLSLDVTSTHRLIEQRCRRGAPEAPLDMARGLLLRDVPGACLWLREKLFHRIGGLDERYCGWGGEDEDMLVRTATAGTTLQFDDVFLHMAHTRPPMRTGEGRPFNAHLTVGSWTGEHGYGRLTGPSGVRA